MSSNEAGSGTDGGLGIDCVPPEFGNDPFPAPCGEYSPDRGWLPWLCDRISDDVGASANTTEPTRRPATAENAINCFFTVDPRFLMVMARERSSIQGVTEANSKFRANYVNEL